MISGTQLFHPPCVMLCDLCELSGKKRLTHYQLHTYEAPSPDVGFLQDLHRTSSLI
ncbi:hypothetical protein SCOR_07890 [Sulfidibacter corallicola]